MLSCTQGRNKVQKIGGANPPQKVIKNSYFPLLYGPSKKIGGAIVPPAPPVVTAVDNAVMTSFMEWPFFMLYFK